MLIEVIATSVEDARIAEQAGAGRIELVSGLAEGGVTPSYGLICGVLRAVTIPVHVMIRPHALSFQYDRYDLESMQEDIRVARGCGAVGIVVGALSADGDIDEEALLPLLREAEGLSVTFHRAFDETRSLEQSFRQLERLPGINRVLTSGGKPSVLEAAAEIRNLLALSRESQISILAGSGLGVDSLAAFIKQTGVSEVHMGTGVRVEGRVSAPLDADKVCAAVAIVNGLRQEASSRKGTLPEP
ncbi:copper homeostasis protein CutC [Paenibacillus filicis]